MCEEVRNVKLDICLCPSVTLTLTHTHTHSHTLTHTHTHTHSHTLTHTQTPPHDSLNCLLDKLCQNIMFSRSYRVTDTSISFCRSWGLPKACISLSSAPYGLHVPPITFFSILPPAQYLVSSTDHQAVPIIKQYRSSSSTDH